MLTNFPRESLISLDILRLPRLDQEILTCGGGRDDALDAHVCFSYEPAVINLGSLKIVFSFSVCNRHKMEIVILSGLQLYACVFSYVWIFLEMAKYYDLHVDFHRYSCLYHFSYPSKFH